MYERAWIQLGRRAAPILSKTPESAQQHQRMLSFCPGVQGSTGGGGLSPKARKHKTSRTCRVTPEVVEFLPGGYGVNWQGRGSLKAKHQKPAQQHQRLLNVLPGGFQGSVRGPWIHPRETRVTGTLGASCIHAPISRVVSAAPTERTLPLQPRRKQGQAS